MTREWDDARAWRWAAWIIGAVTLIRIAVLMVSPLELYPDEAQYWWWAQSPDFGYFSKPPLIAWIIWATTHLFGEREWAIRIGSPLLHAGTSLVLFVIARRLGGPKLALSSALAYATLPGVSYSSGLISTDVPLLFFWAVALYALLRAVDEDEEAWRWPLVCGGAIGLGMLAKYAMLYFLVGMALGCIVSPRLRRLVLSLRGAGLFMLAAGIFAPNLIWNALHRFRTVGHTAANADWSHARYSLADMLAFIGGQFGVFGPLLMIGLVVSLWRLARGRGHSEVGALLACFAVPALAAIVVQSFVAEANANWAATAYVTATPLAVEALGALPGMLPLSFAVDGLAMLLLWAVVVSPALGERLGVGNAFKRQEGWRQLGFAVGAVSHLQPYEAIAVANRSVIAELTYYAPYRAAPLRAWAATRQVSDHFEMTMRLEPSRKTVLLVLLPDEKARVLPTFESADVIGHVDVPIGGHHTRDVTLYDARGYRGPLALR